MTKIRQFLAAIATLVTLVGIGSTSAQAAQLDPTSSAPAVNFFWKTAQYNPAATWIQREVVVEQSAIHTYFSIIGNWTPPFYLGIQQLGNDKSGKPIKVALFSAWDVYADNNCTQCSSSDTKGYGLVKVVSLGENVRRGRFGGEGTGAQAFIDDFNWQIGDTVQAVVHLTPKADGTEISSAIRINDGAWKYFGTYFYPKAFTRLEAGYSFIEDFGGRPTLERSARYQETWMESELGEEVFKIGSVTVDPNGTNPNVGFHKIEERNAGAWAKTGGSLDFSEKRNYVFDVSAPKVSKIDDGAKKAIFEGQQGAYANYLAQKLALAEKLEAQSKAALLLKQLKTSYANCRTLNAIFVGGISKSTATVNKGSRNRLAPTVSAIGYKLNAKLDKDKDGIACER